MPFGPKVGTRRPGLEPQKKKRCGEMRPQTIRRVEARIERWQATLAEMKAELRAGRWCDARPRCSTARAVAAHGCCGGNGA